MLSTSFVISLSDIDECAADRNLCQPYGSCENRLGSYVCVCNHGYALSEDRHNCEGTSSLILDEPHSSSEQNIETF